MLIYERNKLDEDKIREINKLVEQCNNYDGIEGMIELDSSINFDPEMNTLFMAYEDNKLIGALSLFVPGRSEAEVTAMVLPEYRQKGCFSELLKRASAEVTKYGVPDLLFVCHSDSVTGKAAIAKMKAQYEFTEYLLKYNHSFDTTVKEYAYRLKLHQAGLEDIESIAKISSAAFNDSYEGARRLAEGSLNADNRQVFLGEIEGKFIAKGVICKENGGASINGLGVLPEYQGKGYGKEMLYSITSKILEQKIQDIYIEVDSENANAFRLYKNSGFDVISAWEYHRKSIE